MTSALQRSTSTLPEQRSQAIILLGPAEKRSWPFLFAYFQKERFFGYHVRHFTIYLNETPAMCLSRNHIESVPPESYVVICNGLSNTTEQPASTFFTETAVRSVRSAINGREAWTPQGSVVTRYIRSAIQSNLWEAFYSKSISSSEIHENYCRWIEQIQTTEGNLIESPIGQSRLIKLLHWFLPNVYAPRRQFSTQNFPSKQEIEEQWKDTEQEIAKHKPLYSLPSLSSSLKRKADALEHEGPLLAPKKQKLGGYLAFSKDGKGVARYIEWCINNKGWLPFYSKIVPSASLYKQYCTFVKDEALSTPTHKRMFMRTLHGLLPDIYCVDKFQGMENFPSSDVIETQWKKTQAKIQQQKMALTSTDTVDRFVHDPANKTALEECASPDALFEKYVGWCAENGMLKSKKKVYFFRTLNALKKSVLYTQTT